jgi:hypothetical protein
MYNKQKLVVTSITALGVWLNLYNSIKLRNDFKNIKGTKKDARGTGSDPGV